MLIEAAVGDALGAGFEYVSPEIVTEFGDKLEYRAHPKHKQITPGKYTDDTQMSLAIVEAMLDPKEPWTEESLAERFVSVFKRDERTGYSRRLYGILTSVNSGTELLATIKGDSDRSGAAMRAFPIGLYSDVGEVIQRCWIQAEITHNTTLGIQAAEASALMSHYFAHDVGDKTNLGMFLDRNTGYSEEIGSWGDAYVGKVGAQGWMSVKAAVTAVMRNDSLAEILKDCIRFTGDVDTVATIALGCASMSRQVKQDLPHSLYDGLENGTYGRDYILGLDKRLLDFIGV